LGASFNGTANINNFFSEVITKDVGGVAQGITMDSAIYGGYSQLFKYWGNGGSTCPMYFTNYGGNNLTGLYLSWQATSFTSTSDRRLKKDITPVNNVVDKIKNCGLYTFIKCSYGTNELDFCMYYFKTNNLNSQYNDIIDYFVDNNCNEKEKIQYTKEYFKYQLNKNINELRNKLNNQSITQEEFDLELRKIYEKYNNISDNEFEEKKLSLFKFNYSNKEVGILAQEWTKNFPEIITKNDTTGELGVQYDRVGSIAIQGINELNEIIKTQQQKIDQMHDIIKTQQQKIDQMQNEIQSILTKIQTITS
jgi:hypothetical protein